MNIGILTYYRVANFGANLQALSTYSYLKGKGHDPLFILYESEETAGRFLKKESFDVQKEEHVRFVDSLIREQSGRCLDARDVSRVIAERRLDAVIIGSDAVLQHHPLVTRIKRGRRKPLYIQKKRRECQFPNCFWGCGLPDGIPVAMMSVSSQNSGYRHFGDGLMREMAEALSRMRYLSVRDEWTRDMVSAITRGEIVPPVTPDPVFSFNENAGHLVPDENALREKYRLPEKYVLVSLMRQDLSVRQMEGLKREFSRHGMGCVAFPMPVGIRFRHPFDYAVEIPLPVLDWYGLIKHASAYVGSNMHPVVVSLHNGVPCYSLDNWGTTNFWGKHLDDGSSKVAHILKVFGLEKNRTSIDNGKCDVDAGTIVGDVLSFPCGRVLARARSLSDEYGKMMEQIMASLAKPNQ